MLKSSLQKKDNTSTIFLRRRDGAGFTLIELLIVIAVIAIISSVVFVALDPLTRFQDARDASRWSDVTALISAIKLDQVDNKGLYLWAITNTVADTTYMISSATTTTGCNLTCDATISSPSDCVNLQGLVDEGYISSLPESANGAGSWSPTYTGYYFIKNLVGIITIGACESENTSDIFVAL